MMVYITCSGKTNLSMMRVEELPLWHLTVGGGWLAKYRGKRQLERLHASGVRRCICREPALTALANEVDITTIPVLPMRLRLLDTLLAACCPDGLEGRAAAIRCGAGGEETARQAAAVLARRARYLRLEMDDPAPLARELLERWGVSAGDGGRQPACTVVCGRYNGSAPDTPTVYLTEDCQWRQTPVWKVRRADALPLPVTEQLIAALLDAGKWQPCDIQITSLLDISTENHYNAT